MTHPAAHDAKELLDLAERLGMPADEALRQVRQLVEEVEQAHRAPAPPHPERAPARRR
jgi:hypothetical protein